MRRRILLERAAWQLRDSHLSVTEIALDAGYGSRIHASLPKGVWAILVGVPYRT
jgi:transcriptional regulator GlxA family with amidase domain